MSEPESAHYFDAARRNWRKSRQLKCRNQCQPAYPWFICMDADSILQHDSLEKIVRPVLEDENVTAVGGSVRPADGVVIKKGHVIKYRLPERI